MEEELLNVIAVVVSFLIGLISASAYYQKFKKALKTVRNCIDTLDNALADDKLTKEEVKLIWERCIAPVKEMIKK